MQAVQAVQRTLYYTRAHTSVRPHLQHPPQEAARGRVHAGGWLVKQHQWRAAHQRHRNTQLALVAAAVHAAQHVCQVLQPQLMQQLIRHAPHALRRRHAAQRRVHVQHLAARHGGRQRLKLRAVAKALARARERRQHRVAGHEHLAGVWRHFARHDLERGRLAGAVDAQQAKALAREHAQP